MVVAVLGRQDIPTAEGETPLELHSLVRMNSVLGSTTAMTVVPSIASLQSSPSSSLKRSARDWCADDASGLPKRSRRRSSPHADRDDRPVRAAGLGTSIVKDATSASIDSSSSLVDAEGADGRARTWFAMQNSNPHRISQSVYQNGKRYAGDAQRVMVNA